MLGEKEGYVPKDRERGERELRNRALPSSSWVINNGPETRIATKRGRQSRGSMTTTEGGEYPCKQKKKLGAGKKKKKKGGDPWVKGERQR